MGREICFIERMFNDISLWSGLSDSVGFKCGSSVVVLHSSSNFVLLRWNSVFILLRYAPPSVFIRNSVRVVGDLIHS